LNVFPVPDGDTGTNMLLTLRSAVKEVEAANPGSLSSLAKAASTGSMMGARGNSGVILSQLLRGMAQYLEGREEASGGDLANALQSGVKTAYKAVMKPIEGTMLTVAREAAQGAVAAARREEKIMTIMEAVIRSGEEALAHTPELLPVLKKAGVVDAGGKGLLVIWQGMREALQLYLEGRRPAAEATQSLPPAEPLMEISYPAEELTYAYCTEAVIQGSGLPLAELQEQLAGLGDSLVVAGSEDMARIHIHTNHPGLVLESCLQYGSISRVKIDNMREQHQQLLETAAGAGPQSADPPAAPAVDLLPNTTGVVAVVAGSGLAEILQSLGVEQLVEGGQSMNPSIEDLVLAIDQVPAGEVLVLPNNSNVILAAEQASGLTRKKVKVVPTRSFPQAIAAMIAFNPAASLEENCPAMLEAVERVRSGEVTYAVRDSQLGGVDIRAGQILGLVDGRILAVGSAVSQVVEELLGHLVKTGNELITLYWGHQETEASAQQLAAQLRQRYPQAEVEVYFGGQPLYYYYLSVE
ncbi:MAG: DAK2 domain-containing protein, partial [Syntrophomonadaceae bacterium]|nr:DAK2 domain-containing protein [Syntrophomonadaceae bacterium]